MIASEKLEQNLSGEHETGQELSLDGGKAAKGCAQNLNALTRKTVFFKGVFSTDGWMNESGL